MAKYNPQQQSFLGGLNTKQNIAGLPLGQHATMTNVRMNEGVAARRPGMKRIDVTQTTGSALLFAPDETSSEDAYVTIPLNAAVHTLPPQFTIDVVINPDEVVGTGNEQQVIGFSSGTEPFALFWTADSTVKFVFTDEDEVETILETSSSYDVSAPDTSLPIRVIRDGSTLSLLVGDTQEDSSASITETAYSATPTGDLIIGSANHGTDSEYAFSGVVDDFRIWHVALSGNSRAWVEWHDPRYPGLVAMYRFDEVSDDSTLVVDDSRYGNHGGITGAVTFTTGITTALEPVVGIQNYQHSDGSRKALLAVGETMYYSKVV